MAEGPTKGITSMFFLCAYSTILDPGSAMHGHPASDITPVFCPEFIASKKLGISLALVFLFNVKNLNSEKGVFIFNFFKNRLALRIFSTINVVQLLI